MFEYYFVIGYTSLHIFNFCVLFIMHCTLTILEILENIFVFLSRKKLYKGCTRVNRQWKAVSTYIIQNKRKNELINIPNIRDNIFSYLYSSLLSVGSENGFLYNIILKNYCDVNKLWKKKFIQLCRRESHLSLLEQNNQILNLGRHAIGRKYFKQ